MIATIKSGDTTGPLASVPFGDLIRIGENVYCYLGNDSGSGSGDCFNIHDSTLSGFPKGNNVTVVDSIEFSDIEPGNVTTFAALSAGEHFTYDGVVYVKAPYFMQGEFIGIKVGCLSPRHAVGPVLTTGPHLVVVKINMEINLQW